MNIQQVKDAIPHGAIWDFHDNPPSLLALTNTGPFGKALIAEGRADFTPEQVHERITGCEGCGGKGWRPIGEMEPTNRPDPAPCRTCSPYRRLVEK